MRILWNDDEQYFQADLTPGDQWRDDMEAVKAAGFKTTGPPNWVWYSSKIACLNKLREQRPQSGLSITEVALCKFKFLDEQDKTKQAVKKQFEQAKKAAKKLEKKSDPTTVIFIPEKGYIDASDLPPITRKYEFTFEPSPHPDQFCFVCGEPVYFYEYPDICLWCDKVQNIA